MIPDRLGRRIRRRETHTSRAVPAITVATFAALASAWLATETVLAALDRPALLLSPAAMLTGITRLPSVAQPLLLTAAVALVVLGVVLVALALRRGRLARRTLPDERAVVIVHDEAIGSALVRTAADAAAIDPDRAVATVGARRAVVRITPTSGADLDVGAVQRAVAAQAEAFGATPPLRTRVLVDTKGRVGA